MKNKNGLLIGAFLGAFIGNVLATISAGFELGLSTLSFPYSVSIAVTAIIISVLMKTRPDLLQLPKVAPAWMERFLTISTS